MSVTVHFRMVKHAARTSLTEALTVKTTPGFICFTNWFNFKSCTSLKSSGNHQNWLISFFHYRFPIVHQIRNREFWKYFSHMDHFIVISPECVPKGDSQTPEPPWVLWCFHYPQWPGSHHRPFPGVAYFSTFYLNYSKKFSIPS